MVVVLFMNLGHVSVGISSGMVCIPVILAPMAIQAVKVKPRTAPSMAP